MKITNQSNNKRKIIITAAIVICLAALAFGVYWYLQHHNNNQQTGVNKVNLNPPTKEEQQAGTSAKQQAVDRDQAIKNSESSSASTPSSDSSLSVDITASNKTSSLMQIRVQINSIVNSGTCDITLTNGTSSVHHSVAVSPLASTSTCKGFDIPLSELSSGKWNYTITVKDASSNQTGTASGTFSI